jgi:hypothetical protein
MDFLFWRSKNKAKVLCLVGIFLLGVFHKAIAGPPFLTDDPESIDYKHYEVYLFSELMKNDVANLEPDLLAPAIEFNYGLLPRLQLHTALPYAWSLPDAAPAANGLGDIELGMKYQFFNETTTPVQLAIFPLLELPTGNSARNLGNGKPWVKLPIWLQKSWGSWTTYGGGGYAINSASDMRNYFYLGGQLQKKFSEYLILGAEIFYQGAASVDSRATTIFNAGGYYYFNKHLALLFSAGHSLFGQNNTVGYLGIYWTDAG